MGILDPRARNELLAISGFRKFVESSSARNRCIGFLKRYREGAQSKEMSDPYFRAGMLKVYLQFYENELANLMWEVWRGDKGKCDDYYERIAKYFVDLEGEGSSDAGRGTKAVTPRHPTP